MVKTRTAGGGRYPLALSMILAGMVTASQVSAISPDYREVPVAERDAFKVCADPNDMPVSNDNGEGFANKIAELFADALGMELEYYYFPQRMAFIRNTLRKQIDDNTYACDIVMSVPKDFDQGTPTIPYFRSSYVLVFKDDWKYSDEIQTPEDLANLPEEQREGIRFGVFDRSPGQMWAYRNGFMRNAEYYQSMIGDLRKHVGDIMQDVIDGKVTHTIVWGPIAGWWAARKAPDAGFRILPLHDDPDDARMRFEYTFSMGVRHGDYYMRSELDDLIDTYQDEINEILESYGIPLLPL